MGYEPAEQPCTCHPESATADEGSALRENGKEKADSSSSAAADSSE
jgi:hypothetical protein